MSKETIEVCSIHKGKISLTLKDGEKRTVVFQDRGNVGVAMVDEKVAEHLLDGVGRPDYFKSGAIEVGGDDKKPEQKQGGETGTGMQLSEESYGQIGNANQLKSLLKECDDKDLVMRLVAIETNGEKRDTWINALNARLEELAK